MILLNNKRIDGVSLDTVPVGTISPFIGLVAPQGYLLCQGQKVSKNRYKQLYNICKSLFGPETETEFYLPDLRGRVIAGLNENDTTMNTIGKLLGTHEHNHSTGNHTLTVNEMPSHTHSTGGHLYVNDGGNICIYSFQSYNWGVNLSSTGGGGAHNHGDTGLASNYQPTTVMNYIVKAEMVIPNQSTVYDGLDSDSEVNSLSARQGKILNAKIDSLVIPTVNNTLTSTSTTQALSAAQGKVLNDKIDNLLPIIEAGRVDSGYFIEWVYGSNEYYYASVTFKKKYTNKPGVIVNFGTSTSKSYWGDINPYVREVSTTGFTIVVPYRPNRDLGWWIDYIVINNG